MNSPIEVAITGAAGQIGYALVFRVASGAMFGPEQPVALHLIEIPAGFERRLRRGGQGCYRDFSSGCRHRGEVLCGRLPELGRDDAQSS